VAIIAKSAVFAVLLLLAVYLFARNCVRLYRLVRLGRPESRFDGIPRRIGWFLWYVFGQRKVVNEGPGVNHFFRFWGFWVLLAGDIEFLIRGVFPSFSYGFLGPTAHGAFLTAQEMMAIISFAAALIAVALRVLVPRRLYGRVSAEALGFLVFIVAISTCVVGANSCQEALGNHHVSAFRPLTHTVALGLQTLQPGAMAALGEGFWWVLAAILLTFFYVFPWPFHLHIVGAMANVFFRKAGPVNTLAPVDFEAESGFGAGKVTDFTWKQLLDGYACNECARCQANCPAYVTDKPLSPKKIVLDVKASHFERGDALLKKGQEAEDGPPLVGGSGVQEDELWSCTACGACMEQCPVFIEQLPKIVDMRRNLVMVESKFPAELNAFFRNLETNGNPWPIPASQRADWAAGLDVPLLRDKPDVEYLFWVGCAGAFNDRTRKVSVAMVRLMREAGVSFAILGIEERCTGDAARRLGHEYLFQELANQNIETLNRYGVKRIVTFCPHCYNALKNDYPQLGGRYEVVHHSRLLAELLREGKLRLNKQATRAVFHDPCYLGRMNNLYSEPREVLDAAAERLEMRRSRSTSFCCGAGGGRMWMEEKLGRRINHERMREALGLKPQAVAVSCPFCNQMLGDAVNDLGAGDDVQVLDIAEIAAAGLSSTQGGARIG
jgi:Fe-S oxidoreductase